MIFALAGNQNCGKTTLFNQLTGSNQHVGNFPGVTVDQKSGAVRGQKDCEVVDLPGIYSIRPYTPEEIVTRDFILNQKPDGIINIVDATNIERNLYLTLQLMEMRIPMVLALNMMDEVTANGGTIDIKGMSRALGIPVIPISAVKNEGVDELIRIAVSTAKNKVYPQVYDFCSPGPVHRCIHAVVHQIEDHAEKTGLPVRFAATKLIEGDEDIQNRLELDQNELELLEHSVQEMEAEHGMDRNAALADMRYDFIEGVCRDTVVKCRESKERGNTTAAVCAVTKNADGTLSLTSSATGENGCAVALVQPTTDYGTLAMDVTPDSIGTEHFENGSTTLSYTATYELSENIRNQIGNAGQTFTLSIDFDDSLRFAADTVTVNGEAATATVGQDGVVEVSFRADEVTDRVTITFDAELASENFVAGGQLVTTGEVSATFSIGSVSTVVFVPSQAVLTEMESYRISASAETGGSISPSGEVHVNQGGSITFTITPDSGYEIADVLVDGVSAGAVRSYKFENVTRDHTISAIFRSTGGGSGVTRYTITAAAGEGGSISPSGSVQVRRGNDQTFTIEADEGYKISDVLVDGKRVGAVSSYTFENVRARHTIEAVFAKIGTVTDPDDTGVSDWLNTDDHNAYLSGYPNNLFGPDWNMTRAEAAQMFYNLLLDKDVPVTVGFDDVDSGAWYADAVNTLASLGILNGVGDRLYAPERAITRAEFTAIAMRFAHLETGGENSFSDVQEDAWFYDIVVGSSQYGWISGYPDGTFRPYDTITRAEVTTIVNRMLGRRADVDFVDSHLDSVRQFSDLECVHWAYYDIAEAANGHTYRKDKGTENWTGLD